MEYTGKISSFKLHYEIQASENEKWKERQFQVWIEISLLNSLWTVSAVTDLLNCPVCFVFLNLQAKYFCGFSVLRASGECSDSQNTLKWGYRCVEGKVILA